MLKKWFLFILPFFFLFAIVGKSSTCYFQKTTQEFLSVDSFDSFHQKTASEIFHLELKKNNYENVFLFSSAFSPNYSYSWSYQLPSKLFSYRLTHAQTKLKNFYLRI